VPKRMNIAVSDDSDNEMGNATNHKRKASGAHAAQDDDDGDGEFPHASTRLWLTIRLPLGHGP
jgi:hypothetical protein